MAINIQRASERGVTQADWLTSYHNFSFGDYHNPDQLNFGLLRVLNDDTISAGSGFPKHFHKNMEIITIPLAGSLSHKDSEGNESTIVCDAGQRDVQIMSAGTGIEHSEFNASATEPGKFLQIWIETQKNDTQPSYEEKSFQIADFNNHLLTLCSPNRKYGSLLMRQEAWICLGQFERTFLYEFQFRRRRDQGVYIFVIEGSIEVLGEVLQSRDAMSVTELTKFDFMSLEDNTQVLLIEVPLQ